MQILEAENRRNRAIIIAFVASNTFIFLSSFESVLNYPKILKYIASVVVIYQIFLVYRLSSKVITQPGLIQFTKTVFIIVSIVLLTTSVRFEVFYLQEVFAERFFFMPFLIPLLFMNVRYSVQLFKSLLYLTYLFLPLAIIAQIVSTLFQDVLRYPLNLQLILTFAFANSLLLYVSHLFQNKKVMLFSLSYHVVLLIFLASLGRRGESLEVLFPLVFFVIIRLKSSTISSGRKIAIFTVSLVVFIGSSALIYKKSSDIRVLQRGISIEGFNTSRGDTVDNFLAEFGLQPYDYLWGRGLNGTIRKFSEGNYNRKYSRSIEIGYFNILLKGGFIYLIPMVILFISGFYNGFFRSNNDLSKGLALLLLWQLIYMVSFGMANYSVYYFLIWISVSATLDQDFRMMSNSTIMEVFNQP